MEITLLNPFDTAENYAGENIFGNNTDEGGEIIQNMLQKCLQNDTARSKMSWEFDSESDNPIYKPPNSSRWDFSICSANGETQNQSCCSESSKIMNIRARKHTFGSDTSDYFSYNAVNEDNQAYDLETDLQNLELDQSKTAWKAASKKKSNEYDPVRFGSFFTQFVGFKGSAP